RPGGNGEVLGGRGGARDDQRGPADGHGLGEVAAVGAGDVGAVEQLAAAVVQLQDVAVGQDARFAEGARLVGVGGEGEAVRRGRAGDVGVAEAVHGDGEPQVIGGGADVGRVLQLAGVGAEPGDEDVVR